MNNGTIKPVKTGKVRDIYEVGDNLLIVATDRISAFDFILPTFIPDKGKILNQLSLFWFDFLKDVTENHFISADIDSLPEVFRNQKDKFQDRSMLVKKAEVIPFECVVRGYIEGSGWKDYQHSGAICGIKLPENLKRGDKFSEPIFTPSTKAEEGHDINIDFDYMANEIGKETSEKLRDLTLSIYSKAADYALTKGIIIADTKFEFGTYNDEIILIDEVLTPDSSRFWPVDLYKPGQPQPSYDKQFVREYLEEIKWEKQPPVPELPGEIVEKTKAKYLEAFKQLTGNNPTFI